MGAPDQPDTSHQHEVYWARSIRIVQGILLVWFGLSLCCGILFRDLLDAHLPQVGGAPLGFWMAQQGAVIGFLLLLFAYMVLMNRLDAKHGYQEPTE